MMLSQGFFWRIWVTRLTAGKRGLIVAQQAQPCLESWEVSGTATGFQQQQIGFEGMGKEWKEHSKSIRKEKTMIVLLSLFLLLLSGVCAGLLCDFMVALAAGMFWDKEISYEVWCPSLCLPVFGFIWKLRKIRGLFFFRWVFPLIPLKKSVYEGWSKQKDLGDKRTCQPLRQISFSPHLQTMQYFTERGFFAGAWLKSCPLCCQVWYLSRREEQEGWFCFGSASMHSLMVWAGLPLGRRALKCFSIRHKTFPVPVGFLCLSVSTYISVFRSRCW